MNKAGKVIKVSQIASSDKKISVDVGKQDIAKAVENVIQMQSDLVEKLTTNNLGDLQKQLVKKVVLGLPELNEQKDQLEVAIGSNALSTLGVDDLAVQVNVNDISFVLPSKLLSL